MRCLPSLFVECFCLFTLEIPVLLFDYLFYVHIYSTRRTFPSCDLCTALLNMPSRALPPPDAAGVGLPPGWPHGGYPGSCLHHHVGKSFTLFPALNPTAFCCLGLPPEFRCTAHKSLHRQERAGGELLPDTHLGCTWLLVAENITLWQSQRV